MGKTEFGKQYTFSPKSNLVEEIDEFYIEALKAHAERLSDERFKRQSLDGRTEYEFSRFSFYCQAHGLMANEKTFKKYLSAESLELPFMVKQNIAEKYFGYKYEFDFDTKKWKATK